MNASVHRPVDALPPAEKQTLELLLGQKLESDQHVFIFACTPGAMPDDEARRTAHDRIQATLREADRAAMARNVTAEEAEAAVEESLKNVRRRD
jgi:hypothetical protein